MVGHLHLQAMDDSLKGKNREGLLDSPDSGLPPSPSPPFCSLSPGLIDSRSGSCTTPVESHHGYYKRKAEKANWRVLMRAYQGAGFLERVGTTEVVLIWVSGSAETPNHAGIAFNKNSSNGLLPYLLLNSTGTDPKTRMLPVFFGESIEVNPKPEQEIKCNSEVKYDSEQALPGPGVTAPPVPTPTSFSEDVVAVRNCTWRSYKSQTRQEHVPRTTLNYNATGSRRWFVSTVKLESSEDTSPCIIYTEDL
ncbi:hypothetical protein KUCAC02_028997 [Chaenocephalus aceratus]|uniref:Uncharacterized protein n=1 Tax=Chaenocephalus aceratus TaxID=36190 RepID=A0ACB9X596_CHAAC|nr:hypothetical protein KUCAC02_028997 [Chaenocephalus aceratus]